MSSKEPLTAIYNRAVQLKQINDNLNQREVLPILEKIYGFVIKRDKTWFWQKQTTKGLYLYGSIGAGKTFLLNLFYQNLSSKKKQRLHFYDFMQKIDAKLRLLQGKKNPLKQIANNLSKKVHVLCLDEFIISDVTQAMVMAELLPELLRRKIILLITSNIKPDSLYQHGILRERFLPVIKLIYEHCEIVELNNADQRLSKQSLHSSYLYPIDLKTKAIFKTLVDQFIPQSYSGDILIQNRNIAYQGKSSCAIWFEFEILCCIGRSQLDYIELSNQFDVFFLTNVPQFKEHDTIKVMLFTQLIDILYDRCCKLIITAACSIENLYCKGEYLANFQRAKSRLYEMQGK